MYKLEINDQVAEFDGSISIVLNSPIFSDDLSYSLQFNIPDTINNRIVFCFANIVETCDNKSRELNCKLVVDSWILLGTIVVTWQGGAFNGYFKENGGFWSKIKDKKLSSIAFDPVVFDSEKTYNSVASIISNYNTNGVNSPFVFPQVIDKKITDKMPVKAAFSDMVNKLPEEGSLNQSAVVPFLFLQYILKNIIEKNGLVLGRNAFSMHNFLKRLILASNYMLNEFALDDTELGSVNFFIREISNTTDPEITTTEPHNLDNYQFIKIKNLAPDILIQNRIYQIELIYDDKGVKDEYKFKLLGEDFSNYEPYKRCFVKPSLVEKDPGSWNRDRLAFRFVNVDLPDHEGYYFLSSDDWSGIIYIGDSGVDDIWMGSINFYHTDETDTDIINDPDFTTHSFTNLSLLSISEIYAGNFTQNGGVVLHNDYYNSVLEGTITELPSMLLTTFKGINPCNHVLSININEFLSELKKLGILTFVRQSFADIIIFKDVLNSKEFIDISDKATVINDIDNPDQNGYSLKFVADGNDDYYKQMLPVQNIDTKYTIKDPVTTKADLSPVGSETNDVRLVIDENAFYVFNKSFLNADNNWKLLCYNNIDLTAGEGKLKKDVKISPVISFKQADGSVYSRLDIPCASMTFPNDISMNSRLLSFYLVNNVPVATSGTTDPAGNEIEGAELAIRWDGDKGIKNVLLKEYMEWETNIRKDCKALIQWPVYMLSNFDFSRKYRIRGTDYLVKSIKFSIDFKKNRINYNETELAKV